MATVTEIKDAKGRVTGWATRCSDCGDAVEFRKVAGLPGRNEARSRPGPEAVCADCWTAMLAARR